MCRCVHFQTICCYRPWRHYSWILHRDSSWDWLSAAGSLIYSTCCWKVGLFDTLWRHFCNMWDPFTWLCKDWITCHTVSHVCEELHLPLCLFTSLYHLLTSLHTIIYLLTSAWLTHTSVADSSVCASILWSCYLVRLLTFASDESGLRITAGAKPYSIVHSLEASIVNPWCYTHDAPSFVTRSITPHTNQTLACRYLGDDAPSLPSFPSDTPAWMTLLHHFQVQQHVYTWVTMLHHFQAPHQNALVWMKLLHHLQPHTLLLDEPCCSPADATVAFLLSYSTLAHHRYPTSEYSIYIIINHLNTFYIISMTNVSTCATLGLPIYYYVYFYNRHALDQNSLSTFVQGRLFTNSMISQISFNTIQTCPLSQKRFHWRLHQCYLSWYDYLLQIVPWI